MPKPIIVITQTVMMDIFVKEIFLTNLTNGVYMYELIKFDREICHLCQKSIID